MKRADSGDVCRPLGAHMSIAGGPACAVARAREVRATALQIFTKNQLQWRAPELTAEQVADFRNAVRESGLRFVCAHAAYLINVASPDARVRRRSVEALADEVRRADRLGCAGVVVHPGSPRDEGADAGWNRLIEAVDEVLRATADCRARVILENTAGQGNMLGGALSDFQRVFSALGRPPRLGLCVDSCHAFAAGYDLRTASGVRTLVREIERAAGLDRVVVLHLNDSVGGCGSHVDRHAHIGRGEIGLRGFRNLLCEPALRDIPGIIETPKEGRGLEADRRNLALLRALEQGADIELLKSGACLNN